MKKRLAIVAVAALTALGAWGQTGDVRLTMRLLTQRVLPAEPFFVEISLHNGTSAPVSLCTYEGQGFLRLIRIRKPDGTVVNGPWESKDMPMTPLAAGQTASFQTDMGGAELMLFQQPGRYELWAEYESPGRVYEEGQVFGQPPRYRDYWKGNLKSNMCELVVTKPEGEDRQAYDCWLKPYATGKKVLMGKYQGRESVLVNGHEEYHPVNLLNEILRQFPTSTYAAYVVYGYMTGWAAQDPAAVLQGMEGGMFNSNSYPDETGQSKDGWRWLKGKEAADWWTKWYDIILKNHPDIWFADELRLKKAVDQLALKNYQAGAADLATLSKQAKPEVAEKAKQYLDLVKQKGWIKG